MTNKTKQKVQDTKRRTPYNKNNNKTQDNRFQNASDGFDMNTRPTSLKTSSSGSSSAPTKKKARVFDENKHMDEDLAVQDNDVADEFFDIENTDPLTVFTERSAQPG